MRPTLATKFSWSILGIVALSLASSLVTVYGAWRVNLRLEESARDNLPSVRAEEVEILLQERNALLAAYLQDQGNPIWEAKLHELSPRFEKWISNVRQTTYVAEDEAAKLAQLEKLWTELQTQQDKLVSLVKSGKKAEASALLAKEIGDGLTKQASDICDQLIEQNNRYVQMIMGRALSRVRTTTLVVGVSALLTLVLGGFLLWLFFYRVLFPLRGMAADARLFRGDDTERPKNSDEDELRIMGAHLRNLMSDVTDTRTRLERNRERLLAAEKLASVGKLAASVAHEIRNPLTAMKMWLFSIGEAADGDAALARKVRIVSEEMTRLEAIVREFLEFSRPAALNRQPLDVDQLVADMLELLGPRLHAENICIERAAANRLPPVLADAAQIKQVLLNLLNNAADAMPQGGAIRIATTIENDADGGAMTVVRVSDTGAGMPADVQRRIFEPFFTTKETGTGLGLCIAAQVMARHGGAIVLESSSDKGSVFAIWTPVAPEGPHGQDSRG